MKKFLFGIICVAAFSFMTLDILNYKSAPNFSGNENPGYREIYNNEINMKAAREIASITDANRVAVAGDRGKVLAGISVKYGSGNRRALRKKTEKIIKRYYPKAEISVEIQTEKAEKLFETADYMGKGLPSSVLSSRIRYLMESD